jgi:hypothetical protein
MMLGFLNIIGFQLIRPFFNVIMGGDSTGASRAEQQQTEQDFLVAQETGYELVLEREPENRQALQGLVDVRLQQQNLAGALKIAQFLVSLEPDNPDYQAQLTSIQAQMAHVETPGANPENVSQD